MESQGVKEKKEQDLQKIHKRKKGKLTQACV
jgi:hypothetical protein